MNLLLNIWKQPSWIKWLIYFLIVYILFLIKEAFAIVLWFLFCIILYYIILLTTSSNQGLIMKKKFSLALVFSLLFFSCQQSNSTSNENRPHGSQYDLPELTQNNYLMGYLNENRSSYRVSFYDINIDFDIEKKSIDGFVIIKAESRKDLNKIQVDLAENLEIQKISYNNQELDFSREFDAVIIDFPFTIKEGNIFDVKIDYAGIPQNADNPPWAGGFTWSKDKDGRDWVAVSCEGEGARIWWPNKDHITAEGDSVRMAYTVPSNMVAVGNGNLRSVNTQNDKTTYEWFVKNPINNYNISVQIGNYVAIQDTLIKDNNSYHESLCFRL